MKFGGENSLDLKGLYLFEQPIDIAGVRGIADRVLSKGFLFDSPLVKSSMPTVFA